MSAEAHVKREYFPLLFVCTLKTKSVLNSLFRIYAFNHHTQNQCTQNLLECYHVSKFALIFRGIFNIFLGIAFRASTTMVCFARDCFAYHNYIIESIAKINLTIGSTERQPTQRHLCLKGFPEARPSETKVTLKGENCVNVM